MKHINYILGAFISMATVSVSCVDDSKLLFSAEKPVSIEQMEYLNDYDALKSYVDRSANPGFKLGAGITASDYAKKGMIYRLANSNFDEVTAGNAMKYASCVKDNGSMDFSQVVSFVSAAKEAGTTIYGHTLAWHAQQNNKYLNSLIADKEMEIDPDAVVDVQDGFLDYSTLSSFPYWSGGPVKPEVKDGKLIVTNPTKQPNFWDVQFHIANNIPTKKGGKHKVTLLMKGTSAGAITIALGDWGGSSNTKISFTDEWKEVSVELNGIPAENSFIMLQSGDYVGTYEIKWVKVTHTEAAAISWWTTLTTNGDAESNDVSCFFATEQGVGGPKPATIGGAGTGVDGTGHAFVVHSSDAPPQTHSTQFFVKIPRQLMAGAKYRFTMKYRAEKAANSETQSHNNPGGYLFYQMLSPNPSFTTEWQEKSWTGAITLDQAGSGGMNTIAFNLAVFKEANTYYFDDIRFEIEESGNKKPMTPEEKAAALTEAMDTWIAGMMKACDGYVKAWDVVNEPMSDGNTSELKYTSNVSADEAKNNFYWQDYLGKDYARIAIKLARQYGGDGLKLFINDYNLEAAYNSNAKCEGLINMVKYWESDGVTKIDGIGTQMHVTYALKPETQQKNEEAVVKMFQLLAASGKLIKISELDMGISDETGKSILTTNVTQEQHKAMSDYYKFIIKKYFELIPAAQRYGITQWAATDSPADSGWRKGEPIGLWDLNYNRKHTYAGFADGLAGK